ncbi:hypothetical protein NFJ02_04g118670 [Pycnococcus provasolii]
MALTSVKECLLRRGGEDEDNEDRASSSTRHDALSAALASKLEHDAIARRCSYVMLACARAVSKPLSARRLRALHALAAVLRDASEGGSALVAMLEALHALPFRLAPALLDALDAHGDAASDEEAAAVFHVVTGLVLLDQPDTAAHLGTAMASRKTHGHGDAKVALLRVLAGGAPPPGRVRLEWLRLLRAIAYVDRESVAEAGAGDTARGLLRGAHPAEAQAERRACEQLIMILDHKTPVL